jgi:hypothetical protein
VQTVKLVKIVLLVQMEELQDRVIVDVFVTLQPLVSTINLVLKIVQDVLEQQIIGVTVVELLVLIVLLVLVLIQIGLDQDVMFVYMLVTQLTAKTVAF